MSYPLGATPTLTFRFYLDDVLTNPTAITVTFTSPTGVITTVTEGSLTHPSTGVYTYAFNFDEGRMWTVAVDATGAVNYSDAWKVWIKPR